MATTIENRTAKTVKILVINPNTSKQMTSGLDKIIQDLGHSQYTQISTYTAPSGPASINNEDDASASAAVCLRSLPPLLQHYDAFLVACYSVHPLVGALRTILPPHHVQKPITGIFEASISTALSLLAPPSSQSKEFSKFGIVTTGMYWEDVLTQGVLAYLGSDSLTSCARFGGVSSTGLNASELHSAPPEIVREKMVEATRKLVKGGEVGVICLGCAGMAGMDETVRQGCVLELGEKGNHIRIVDGVSAGVGVLEALVRGAF